MKHGREWAGVKRFMLQRVLKDMSIKEWSSTLEQVKWLPVQSILRGETQALSRCEGLGSQREYIVYEVVLYVKVK